MTSPFQDSIQPPPFSDRKIIDLAEQLTRRYARSLDTGPELLTISFEHVYDTLIYPDFGILLEEGCNLGFDERGVKILGRYEPESKKAYLDEILHSSHRDPRRVFTCWHEVGGHGILQGDWLCQELKRLNARHLNTTELDLSPNTSYILERQANLFAAHAAAPTWLLRQELYRVFSITHPVRYIRPGKYSLSVNGATLYPQVNDFDSLCRWMAGHVSLRFGGLSREALGYRIADTGLVVDHSRPQFGLHRTAS